MKTLIVILMIIIGSWGWSWGAERIRVKVEREVPAEKEYYRTNEKGNIERVREYNNGRTIKESYNYDKTTGTLIRERKDEKNRDRK